MKNTSRDNETKAEGSGKRLYSTPRLTRFGLVKDLTRKPGAFSDSNPNHVSHPVGN